MFENKARGNWESFIRMCSRDASLSGQTVADKEETPVIRGEYGFLEARFMIHKHTIGIPVRSSYIYENEVHLVEPGPEPSAYEKEAHSEEIEEIVAEAAEHAEPECQAEHVGDSEEVHQNAEKQASQHVPLSAIHPEATQQSLAISTIPGKDQLDAIAESSRTAITPELQELIEA